MALPAQTPISDRPPGVPDLAGPRPLQSAADQAALHAATQTLLSERHYVQFHPVLARLLAGVKPALMLGHALYWTRNWLLSPQARGAGRSAPEGWFWKTAREWQDATGLSTREQERARQVLRDAGVWQEALMGASDGLGTRLHYCVDLAALSARLLPAVPEPQPQTKPGHPSNQAATNGAGGTARCGEPCEAPALTQAQLVAQLAPLLTTPILYFRALADMAGGPSPGLLLSWLLTRMGEAIAQQQASAEGYFFFDPEQAGASLCLGTKALRNARDALERVGLISVGYAAERQGRLMLRVNLMALSACLGGQRPPERRRKSSTVANAATSGSPIPKLELVPVQAALPGTDTSRAAMGAAAPRAAHTKPTEPTEPGRPIDRAQVTGRVGNITQITRMMLNAMGGAPQGPRANGRGRGQRRSVGLPFCRNGSLAKQMVEREVCRFVETGDAFLSKPYAKEFNTKEPPTTAGAQAREAVAPPPAGRSRVQEVLRTNSPPTGYSAQAEAALPKAEATEGGTDAPTAFPATGAGPGVPDQPPSALVMPKRLDVALHGAAQNLVATAPAELRQAILDELAGALASPRKTIDNPLGWLHAIVSKACAGTLVLTLAHGVQARRAALAQRQRPQNEAEPVAPVARAPLAGSAPAAHGLSPAAELARAQIKEVARRLRLGGGSNGC